MIRLLLFVFVSLSLFSCEDVYTKDDELFYQISEADSARCMQEILDGILEESLNEEQKIRDVLYGDIPYCGPIEVLYISINSIGQIMIQDEEGSTEVSEKVYHYFMFNRFLSSEETDKAAMNVNHPGFEFPIYNHMKMHEIDRYVEYAKEKWEEVKMKEGVEPTVIDSYSSEVDKSVALKNTLELTGASELRKTILAACVDYSYPESEKSEEVLKEITFAFYQMRNYECMHFFGETYLNLYERAQRLNRKIDQEKLKALSVLHPVKIVCRDWGKKRSYSVEPPPEATP